MQKTVAAQWLLAFSCSLWRPLFFDVVSAIFCVRVSRSLRVASALRLIRVPLVQEPLHIGCFLLVTHTSQRIGLGFVEADDIVADHRLPAALAFIGAALLVVQDHMDLFQVFQCAFYHTHIVGLGLAPLGIDCLLFFGIYAIHVGHQTQLCKQASLLGTGVVLQIDGFSLLASLGIIILLFLGLDQGNTVPMLSPC